MEEKIYPLKVDQGGNQLPSLAPKSIKLEEKKPSFKEWVSQRKGLVATIVAISILAIGGVIYASGMAGNLLGLLTPQQETSITVDPSTFNDQTEEVTIQYSLPEGYGFKGTPMGPTVKMRAKITNENGKIKRIFTHDAIGINGIITGSWKWDTKDFNEDALEAGTYNVEFEVRDTGWVDLDVSTTIINTGLVPDEPASITVTPNKFKPSANTNLKIEYSIPTGSAELPSGEVGIAIQIFDEDDEEVALFNGGVKTPINNSVNGSITWDGTKKFQEGGLVGPGEYRIHLRGSSIDSHPSHKTAETTVTAIELLADEPASITVTPDVFDEQTGQVEIQYSLPDYFGYLLFAPNQVGGEVEIEIKNADGQLQRTFTGGYPLSIPGRINGKFQWDKKDANGAAIVVGAYTVNLTATSDSGVTTSAETTVTETTVRETTVTAADGVVDVHFIDHKEAYTKEEVMMISYEANFASNVVFYLCDDSGVPFSLMKSKSGQPANSEYEFQWFKHMSASLAPNGVETLYPDGGLPAGEYIIKAEVLNPLTFESQVAELPFTITEVSEPSGLIDIHFLEESKTTYTNEEDFTIVYRADFASNVTFRICDGSGVPFSIMEYVTEWPANSKYEFPWYEQMPASLAPNGVTTLYTEGLPAGEYIIKAEVENRLTSESQVKELPFTMTEVAEAGPAYSIAITSIEPSGTITSGTTVTVTTEVTGTNAPSKISYATKLTYDGKQTQINNSASNIQTFKITDLKIGSNSVYAETVINNSDGENTSQSEPAIVVVQSSGTVPDTINTDVSLSLSSVPKGGAIRYEISGVAEGITIIDNLTVRTSRTEEVMISDILDLTPQLEISKTGNQKGAIELKADDGNDLDKGDYEVYFEGSISNNLTQKVEGIGLFQIVELTDDLTVDIASTGSEHQINDPTSIAVSVFGGSGNYSVALNAGGQAYTTDAKEVLGDLTLYTFSNITFTEVGDTTVVVTATDDDNNTAIDQVDIKIIPAPPTKTYVCSDKADNDNDGKTDFPNDPGCSSLTDTTEDSEQEICGNGIDDDLDGKIDLDDPECAPPSSAKVDVYNDTVKPGEFNPYVYVTKISYWLDRSAYVDILLEDSKSDTEIILKDTEMQNKGFHYLWWTGTVDNKNSGDIVPDGTYEYRIIATHPDYPTITDEETGSIKVNSEYTGGGEPPDPEGPDTPVTPVTPVNPVTPLSPIDQLGQEAIANAQGVDTVGTGPGIFIYFLFPLFAFAFNRKKQ